MSIAYLNGEFQPLSETRVSVLDRGFLFGDGVYEVIPVFNGELLRLPEHLARLTQSLNGIGIKDPMSRDAWHTLLLSLVAKNGHGDQGIYLQITRGIAPRDHVPRDPISATVFAMSSPLSRRVADPVAAVVIEDLRWRLCHLKTIALLPNVLARMHAAENDAYEAILIRDGQLTEGAASNVFIVTDLKIKTPPKSNWLLPGVTRDLVVELFAGSELAVEEGLVSEAELRCADEIWLTSSTRGIVAVVMLDNHAVGGGVPGPLFKRATDDYARFRDCIGST